MSNIVIADTHLRHARGQDQLKTFAVQGETVRSGGRMTSYFCATCGTLMYRVGARVPGVSILRTGTVDDFGLAERELRPQVEQFVESRVAWQAPVLCDVPQVVGMHTPADLVDPDRAAL
jgi:hypothetical protein